MSERMARMRREGTPKLNQGQKAALECVQFMETRMTGRPMQDVIAIMADAVVHLLVHSEQLTQHPKGTLVHAFGNLLVSMGDSMMHSAIDADVIDEPVIEATEATVDMDRLEMIANAAVGQVWINQYGNSTVLSADDMAHVPHIYDMGYRVTPSPDCRMSAETTEATEAHEEQ